MDRAASAGKSSTSCRSSNRRLVSKPETAAEPIRFYGRRKGKPLKATRLQLLETLLPQLAIPKPEGPLAPATLFARAPDRVWLEVGFGGGEHLAAQAAAHP